MTVPLPNATTVAPAHTHVPVRNLVPKDPASSFKLFVPAHWSRARSLGSIRFEPGRPEPLGFFIESDKPGAAAIVISQIRLSVELRLEDYVRGQCAAEGWRFFHSQWVSHPVGRRLDLAFLRGEGDARSVRRVTAFADHGRALMHSATVRLCDWDRLAETLWVSGASFGLVAPTGDLRFECWSAHTSGFVGLELPESWSVQPVEAAPEGICALDANLVIGDRLAGYVRVKARRCDEPRSLHRLLEVSDREILAAKISPAANKPEKPATHGQQQPPGWLGTFASEASIFGGPGEALYGYRFDAGLELSIVALCPSFAEDRVGFMRTMRAFEIAGCTACCVLPERPTRSH